MGVQAIAVREGKEIASFENADELFQFSIAHRESGFKIEYIPHSQMWENDYRNFVEGKIFPRGFDSAEEFERKVKTINPYYTYKNSVREMLSKSIFERKFVVLLKEGEIDEDNAGDDPFITVYFAHNMDWVTDFVRNFAARCCGEVAIYHVGSDGDVVRLFKEFTSNKKAFDVFTDKKRRYDYDLFKCNFLALGWHIASVD